MTTTVPTIVRCLLLASILSCLLALISSPLRPKYRITALYLLSVLPATAAFQTDLAWLHSWYALLASPVVFLRFFAGVEVAHHQTSGFRWWWLLMLGILLTPILFSSIGWVCSPRPALPLQEFVELRRLLQIYMAGVFVCLEAFWVTQGGGWMIRRADRIATAFGLLLLSHGSVSVWMGARQISGEFWQIIQPCLWLIDSACYLWLTFLFRGARRSLRLQVVARPVACDPNAAAPLAYPTER